MSSSCLFQVEGGLNSAKRSEASLAKQVVASSQLSRLQAERLSLKIQLLEYRLSQIEFKTLIAILIWSMSSLDTVRIIALSVAFASDVTTVMFNLNILMRFGGYYMAVDLLEAPNMYSRGAQYIDYLFQH